MRPEDEGGARSSGEAGFAMVAALFGLLLFSLLAYTVLAADRGETAEVAAAFQRARMEATAEAAIATVVDDLGRGGGLGARQLVINDMDCRVEVEDERGKVPLNGLQPDGARRLLRAAGVSGRRLDALADSLLDWQDGQERPNGARTLDYAAEGVRVQRGPLHSLDELAAIHGFDPELVARLTPALTLFPDPGGVFDPRSASPLARAAMAEPGAPAPRPPASAGYIGHPLTLKVQVSDGGGGRFDRAEMVELTGLPGRPLWIRAR